MSKFRFIFYLNEKLFILRHSTTVNFFEAPEDFEQVNILNN